MATGLFRLFWFVYRLFWRGYSWVLVDVKIGLVM